MKNMVIKLLFLVCLSVCRACQVCPGLSGIKNTAVCLHIQDVVVGYNESSKLCSAVRQSFAGVCCDQGDRFVNTSVAYVGPYKPCNICGRGYPQKKSMVMHFLYLGVGTCPQYYVFG